MEEKKYKRKNWTLGIPKVSVMTFLAKSFIEEANAKEITLTGLMNKILAKRYNIDINYQIKNIKKPKEIKNSNSEFTILGTLTVEPKLINLFFREIIDRNLAISHLLNEILAEQYSVDLKQINYEKYKKYLIE